MPRQWRRKSCCRELRQVVEVGAIRSPRVKARMRAPAVVEVQIPPERASRLADAIVGPQIDLLVFDRTPQPLDKHIVAPGAATIHADRDPVLQQKPRKGRAGEPAALVGVEYFRPAMPSQRVTNHFKAKLDLYGDR